MPNVLRASVVQTCTASFHLDETLLKLERLARIAKERDGSQLAVFPEAFVGGYPKMSTFGVVVGERSDAGRDEFVRYHNAAVDIPGPTISKIESISAEVDIFLVIGVIERDGGTLYCTVVFIDPKDGFVAKHRKLQPTAMERVIWGQGGPDTLAVVEKNFDTSNEWKKLKITASICWQNYMPLLRTFYYSRGTHIYCAPTVDARPQWQHTMVHIALEGRCFVLSACQFSQEKDFPADHAVRDPSKRDPENIMIGGGSVIVSALGEVLAGPLWGEEGVLTAELDLDDIVRGKFDMDCVGHYARPDGDCISLCSNTY
ncbi:carbon-nitrogen hydrolase [Punctularia strigosozonata HHB-11173 SS5]|uniref:carbon-nitrogen hydrolase n=1 Tax=Punctularia strigosozonata (strain HHB-11173) TaxID=741275 RepID=UPI0004416664|nr:carbon-nitrogen hydrolase [Punctularia strigosozonata HHB-11173 SS5]EIN14128.1 carbon-nitrogen hydrolase [Punctularia strigosozonata HHB-11173 SS5]